MLTQLLNKQIRSRRRWKYMKNILTFALLLIASAVCTAQSLRSSSLVDSQSDSLVADHKIVYIDGKPETISETHIDSLRHLINMFYYDQFRNFSDPAAPYFLFMGKDAALAMGVGGCVRMRGWYDWGGAIPANGFAPYLIPMHPDPTKMRKFNTTPSGTTLFFRVIGRNKQFGEYQLYIEANFNGYNRLGFNLKKAYAIVRDWTIGYAASTFSDPSALPPTVDASGPNNKMSPTNVLVRWMHTWRDRITVAASAETPQTSPTEQAGLTAKVDNWLPDAAVFVQYAWGRSEHVRLSGIVRSLSYRNLVAERNHNLVGWGAQLSAVGHPLKPLTLYGTFCGGAGFESLGGDLQMGTYDLVPEPGQPGRLYAPYAIGWNLGVQYNFRPNLFASVTFAESRYLPRDGAAGSEYKYGQYMAANIFWNLTPRIQTGLEFTTGVRKNVDGEHRRARRIGLMAQFSF